MTLNLDQVREAGVFAWREDGYLFADGRIMRVRNGDPRYIAVVYSGMRSEDAQRLLNGGWRHMPECACTFCQPLEWTETDQRAWDTLCSQTPAGAAAQ
jgi:hypothetical protein